jgi:WD40 repeat protein
MNVLKVAIALFASALLAACDGGTPSKPAAQNAAPPVAVVEKTPAPKKVVAPKKAPEAVEESVSSWAFSKNNRFFVIGKKRSKGEHAEGWLEVWDVRKRQKLKAWKTDLNIVSLDVSPNNRTFISGNNGSDGSRGRLWDLRSGKLLRYFDLVDNNPSVAFSASGREVVVGNPLTLQVHSVKSSHVLRQLNPENPGDEDAPPFINDLAVSPDGKLIITSVYHLAEPVIVYDFKTLEVRWKGSIGADGRSIVLSRNGYYIASIIDDGIHIYRTRSGKRVRILGKTESNESHADAVAFSSDGKTLVDNGGKNALRVWSVATGKLKRTLPGKADAFSRDGKIAVTFDKDNKPQFRSIPIDD